MSAGVISLAEEQVARSEAASQPASGSVLAHIKRFTERYRGDAAFRDLLKSSLKDDGSTLPETLLRFNLEISPEDARSYLAAEAGDHAALTENLKSYSAFIADTAKTDRISSLAASGPNARYNAWRQRQLAALRFRFSALSDMVARPTVAYEVSRGCSVGCWFCAVGAEKLQSHFTATEENLALFRAVLTAMRELLGEAAGSGMCYWATDPLDNPDYEQFTAIFSSENRAFPPTTTALAAKNPDRTREILRTAAAHGMLQNRFSVLSLGMLNRIHATFSAEELLSTDLVFQMPNALVAVGPASSAPARKINAGKARSLTVNSRANTVDNRADTVKMDGADDRLYAEDDGTVACVIGFLFNLVDRTVKLITPCVPSDTNPLGYRILSTINDIDAANIKPHLTTLIDRHMAPGLGDAPLALHPTLSIEAHNGLLTVRSPKHALSIPCHSTGSVLEILISLLRTGTNTGSQILENMRLQGMGLLQTHSILERLQAEGVFEP